VDQSQTSEVSQASETNKTAVFEKREGGAVAQGSEEVDREVIPQPPALVGGKLVPIKPIIKTKRKHWTYSKAPVVASKETEAEKQKETAKRAKTAKKGELDKTVKPPSLLPLGLKIFAGLFLLALLVLKFGRPLWRFLTSWNTP